MSYCKSLILSASLLLCCPAVLAETPTHRVGDEMSLSVPLQTLLESSGRDNLIDLFQMGEQNEAMVAQLGDFNNLIVTQIGVSNQTLVFQQGSDNEVDLFQAGYHNSAEVTQIGDNNLVQIKQLGSANFSIQQLGNGASIAVTQY
ncbi:curlin [Shewanella sp. FJAT-52076]|uniref:curlin n=1 Tax=Shewanella sp. FJAT-52076 TaxID=2864202 RepID=UPI001C661558|nr:curlin [Shewanella sp. FJAT-52076]QYJ74709.1 curlin [Shewanella sp. FJAT-52076]